jgi:hypothetical protein
MKLFAVVLPCASEVSPDPPQLPVVPGRLRPGIVS